MNFPKIENNQNGFEVGDIVFLKSGSPPLTVTGIDLPNEDVLFVAWINEDGVAQEFKASWKCFKIS